MWSTVTSTPLAVPQSLAYLSNQASYDGTKWLHWRIFRVFWGRLIRMVGPPPSAAARATPVVVVTNSRRSMLLRLVIEMASHGSKERCQVSGAGCQVRIYLTPETWHLSERVEHAEGILIGAGDRKSTRLNSSHDQTS